MTADELIVKKASEVRAMLETAIRHAEGEIESAEHKCSEYKDSASMLAILVQRRARKTQYQRVHSRYQSDLDEHGCTGAMARLMQRAMMLLLDTSTSTDLGWNIEHEAELYVARQICGALRMTYDSPEPYVGALRHMAEREQERIDAQPYYFVLGEAMSDGRFQVSTFNKRKTREWHFKTYAKGERAKARREADRAGLVEIGGR